jgi:hypothetical protein
VKITITIELSDKEVQFVKTIVSDMNIFESMTSIEETAKECVRTAKFDESEPHSP